MRLRTKREAEPNNYAPPQIETVVNLSPEEEIFMSRAFLNTAFNDSPANIKTCLSIDKHGQGEYYFDFHDCHNKAHIHGSFHDGKHRGTENFFYKIDTIIAHLLKAREFAVKRLQEVTSPQKKVTKKRHRNAVFNRGGLNQVEPAAVPIANLPPNGTLPPPPPPPPPPSLCIDRAEFAPHPY